eukprot:7544995-Karenia_brevis.AAC.1
MKKPAAVDKPAQENTEPKQKKPNPYTQFIAEKLKDKSFCCGGDHKARFTAAVQAWQSSRPPIPTSKEFGCGKCRRSKTGCIQCNPAKKQAYLEKKGLK